MQWALEQQCPEGSAVRALSRSRHDLLHWPCRRLHAEEVAVDVPHVGLAQLDDLVEDRLRVLHAGVVVGVDQDRDARVGSHEGFRLTESGLSGESVLVQAPGCAPGPKAGRLESSSVSRPACRSPSRRRARCGPANPRASTTARPSISPPFTFSRTDAGESRLLERSRIKAVLPDAAVSGMFSERHFAMPSRANAARSVSDLQRTAAQADRPTGIAP